MLADAKRDLIVLERAPRATLLDANKQVRKLLGSYQQKVSNPDVFMRQVAAAMVDAPLEIVERIADAREGIVASHKFLPSISEIRAWIDKQDEYRKRRIERLESTVFTLTPSIERTPGDVRVAEAKVQVLRKQQALERLAKMEPAPMSPRLPGDKLLEALVNLEAQLQKDDGNDVDEHRAAEPAEN